jgi:hypothetical protein
MGVKPGLSAGKNTDDVGNRIFGRISGEHVREEVKADVQPMKSSMLFSDILTLENGTDTLSRNVGKGLPLDTALYCRRAQISSASRRKPEITAP